MKIVLFILLLLTGFINVSPGPKLDGRWEVCKVDVKGRIIYPSIKNYYLIIDKSGLRYNLDVNSCGADSLVIDKKRITFRYANCTEACCDCHLDTTVCKYIDYRGTYVLDDSLLIITNKKARVFLKRQAEE